MESSYGVGVKNRFDLFIDDENDPLDIVAETERRKQQDKTEKKDTRTSRKPNETKTIENVKGSTKSESTGRKEGDQEKKSGRSDREKRGAPSGSRDHDRNALPPRYNNERRREQRVAFADSTDSRGTETKGEDREQSGRPFRERPTERGRGRGGRGFGRNRRDFEGKGKREFDRRSGSDKSTYRGPNDKREGGGPHNWGNVADEAGEGEVSDEVTGGEQVKSTEWAATSSEEVEKKETGTEEATTEETTAEGGEESAGGDDSAKQMTLDEYKAEQEKLRMRAEFKLRKASEGEDSHKWAKAVPFQRNDDFESGFSKLDDADKGHKSGRVKETVSDIRIRFYNPPPSRGRGRGRGESDMRGSGRGSGRGGRGGFHPQNSDRNEVPTTAPNFENQDDFPALGGN